MWNSCCLILLAKVHENNISLWKLQGNKIGRHCWQHFYEDIKIFNNKCCKGHMTIKKWVGGQSASQLFNLRLKLFNYSRDCFYRALQREADAQRSNGVGSAAAKSEGAESYYTTRNISRARGEPCSWHHYFILKQATGCGLSLRTSFWVHSVALI